MHHDALSQDFDLNRTVLRAGTLVLAGMLILASPAQAAQPVNPPSEPTTTEPVTVIERINGTLNGQTSLVRSMVNECLLAGVASVVVAMSISGLPAGPVATAALGAVPSMSSYTIGALGCGAGAVAGAASAALMYAWEDRSAVAEAVATPLVAAWTAIEEADEWSIAGLASRGGEAVYAALGGTASTMMAWFQSTPEPAAETTMLASVQPRARPAGDLVHVSYQSSVTPVRVLRKRPVVGVP
jgi:hypothetical protein